MVSCLNHAAEQIIGTKQNSKSNLSGIVQEIIVAKDADDRIAEQIVQLA